MQTNSFWIRNNGSTPSGGTGPTGDATTGMLSHPAHNVRTTLYGRCSDVVWQLEYIKRHHYSRLSAEIVLKSIR